MSMLPLLMLACQHGPDSATDEIIIPGHNDCLPEGEEMSEDTCLAVVEDFGHYPTQSENKSGMVPQAHDPRVNDPEYIWLTEQVNRCTCRCCHTEHWGGAGVYFWDLDYKPVWTDSASVWSLSVFGGWTDEYLQTLPVENMERVRAYISAEVERRH